VGDARERIPGHEKAETRRNPAENSAEKKGTLGRKRCHNLSAKWGDEIHQNGYSGNPRGRNHRKLLRTSQNNVTEGEQKKIRNKRSRISAIKEKEGGVLEVHMEHRKLSQWKKEKKMYFGRSVEFT